MKKKDRDSKETKVDGKSGKKKQNRKMGKLPVKRNINFAILEEQHINWLIAIPSIFLILLVIGVLSKFLVLDRFEEARVSERQVKEMQRRLDEQYQKIEEFGNIEETYAHYTYSGMTKDELKQVDRLAVMDLLDRLVFPSATVGSWSLEENLLTIPIEGSTLEQINQIVQKLQMDDLVDFCIVKTAETKHENAKELNGKYQVTAQVTVYLKEKDTGEKSNEEKEKTK